MSLIRTGLVLGTVVYMMPTDSTKQAELIHTASDTLVWGVTYCEREPATCDKAKALWGQMVEKAKFGAALASDLAQKWQEQNDSRQGAAPVQPASINDLINTDAPFVPDTAAAEPAADWDPSING
jgi:hypothetical protein